MKTSTLMRPALAALAVVAVPAAQAFDWHPDAVEAHAGAGPNGAAMAGAGLQWDWDWERLRRAELTAHTELVLNHWRADAPGAGKQAITQVVLLPTLRMQLSRGQSPWYLELGIGASWMDRRPIVRGEQFSTHWNFYDVVGLGYQFGVQGRHELGLRWVHVSNGGIKEPNPGQDLLQLRYLSHF